MTSADFRQKLSFSQIWGFSPKKLFFYLVVHKGSYVYVELMLGWMDEWKYPSECQEWCLSHGYELVCVDVHAVDWYGDDERDKRGVPRLLEALEATMWSEMSMKGGVYVCVCMCVCVCVCVCV